MEGECRREDTPVTVHFPCILSSYVAECDPFNAEFLNSTVHPAQILFPERLELDSHKCCFGPSVGLAELELELCSRVFTV